MIPPPVSASGLPRASPGRFAGQADAACAGRYRGSQAGPRRPPAPPTGVPSKAGADRRVAARCRLRRSVAGISAVVESRRHRSCRCGVRVLHRSASGRFAAPGRSGAAASGAHPPPAGSRRRRFAPRLAGRSAGCLAAALPRRPCAPRRCAVVRGRILSGSHVRAGRVPCRPFRRRGGRGRCGADAGPGRIRHPAGGRELRVFVFRCVRGRGRCPRPGADQAGLG